MNRDCAWSSDGEADEAGGLRLGEQSEKGGLGTWPFVALTILLDVEATLNMSVHFGFSTTTPMYAALRP